jgi:adenylyltransferase/sulfurtransferase
MCDFDRVETSNLARQVLYSPADVGRPKTEVARERLGPLNPDVELRPLARRFDDELAAAWVEKHDLIVDASDNYGTRLAINRAALAGKKPWVMGSCIRMEGQLVLFSGGINGPCYRCLYGTAAETLEDCPGAGIFAPIAGIIGTAMTNLALAHFAGFAQSGRLHLFDGTNMLWRTIAIGRRDDCPDCRDG